MKGVTIGVSKLAPNYESWLKKLDGSIHIIDFYTMDPAEALKQAGSVSGLLLTGGSDIHPSRFGKIEALPFCKNIDEKRDELEFELIGLAFEREIPVLGICRGQQILNVAWKGTLCVDIPVFLKSTIPHCGEEDVYHPVTISENSLLYRVSGVPEETVNSSHHQAIDVLAPDFTAVAFSPDKIVEAIEAEPSMHPFCLAVQWHPERMDFDNPLSGKIGKAFLEKCNK